jgi:serine/threonine protein kinase
VQVLRAHVAADHDRLARSEREAQVPASLNHSNIANIYGVNDSSSIPALVMELIEGPTLADRIAKGLPLVFLRDHRRDWGSRHGPPNRVTESVNLVKGAHSVNG